MATQRARSKTSTPAESRRAAPSQAPSRKMVGPTRESDDPPGPLVAAYEAGRLLNQLDWHLQQAWLLPAIDFKEARHHAQEVSQILTNLGWTLQPALAVEAEIRLRECLLVWRDKWNHDFGSEIHESEIEGRSGHIRYQLSMDLDTSPSEILEEEWWRALRFIEVYAPDVMQLILKELDERGQRALELGRWVDRGVHPHAAYLYMCRETKPPLVEQPTPEDAACWLDLDGINPASDFLEPPPVLYTIATETIVPEYGWMEQVRRCCRAMGLPEAFFQCLANLERDARESAIETRVASFVADVDVLIRHELADLIPQETIPADERTKPLTLQEAAKLMKLGTGRTGAKLLRAYIDDGSIKCQRLSRQKYYFRKSDFPPEVQGLIV